MMKRFLVSLAFIAFAISAAAAQLPAVLKAEPDGSVQLGNIGMYVIHIGEQWAGSMQRSLNPDEKTKIGPDRIFVSGSFPAANSSDNFTFVEELLPTEAEKVSCSSGESRHRKMSSAALSPFLSISRPEPQEPESPSTEQRSSCRSKRAVSGCSGREGRQKSSSPRPEDRRSDWSENSMQPSRTTANSPKTHFPCGSVRLACRRSCATGSWTFSSNCCRKTNKRKGNRT